MDNCRRTFKYKGNSGHYLKLYGDIATNPDFCYNGNRLHARNEEYAMPTFSEQLKAIRKERNITQEWLANKMNVSRPTISHWENGRIIPDIDTIKRLSQVLDYNFLAVEGMTEATQPAPEAEENTVQETPFRQMETTPCKRKFALPAMLGAVLLCAVLVVCLLMNGKPSDEPANLYEPYSREWYQQEQTPVAGQAFISITPTENPVRMILFEEFPDGKGWFYTFEMKSHTDIDFTVNEIITTMFHTGGTVDPQMIGGEVLTGLYGTNVIDRSQVFELSGGFPEQPIEAVGLLIKGVDAKGNELEFHGYVELSKEIAE